MTKQVKMPDPAVEHCDWAVAMVKFDNDINLRDYSLGTGPAGQLALVEGSRRVTTGMQDKFLVVEQKDVEDERVNSYRVSDSAKTFWQNGLDEGLTAQDILDGWRALQSIADEATGGQEADASA